ncbi:MAG: glutamate formimidoyltransferase [Candidatus Krumholzibacteriia bacterium]
MKQLVECVPNISEGRDRAIIDAVCAVIGEVEGVSLLDVDPGRDTNRTVITFIGPPAGVAEAAFRVVARAAQLIDMARHSGAHPRHGATDVVPFVPVSGVTMDDCVALARGVGARIGAELGIPVYLYEEAAQRPERRNLAHCRQGEYEALPQKLGRPEWTPDHGPDAWSPAVARSGATNVGARQFLVAYNVNLNTRAKRIASDIALDVREQGRARRDAAGNIVKGPDGQNEMVPGALRAVKAVGWTIPEYDRAQISMNLVNIAVTQPHEAFDEVCRQAERRGVRVTGSELVGLVPLQSLLAAGRHYLRRGGESAGVPQRQLIETAIQSLGLRELGPFDPAQKIIEARAGLGDGRLVKLTNREFVDELSTDSPAPGGGSVAALCGAQSAALAAMVGNLTVARKGYEAVQERVKELAETCQADKDAFLAAIDDDTNAFNRVMDAMRLPKGTPAQQTARDRAVAAATRDATRVPLAVLERTPALLARVAEIAAIGNANSLSDAGVAALTALAAAEGAWYNVLINLGALAQQPAADEPDFPADARARGAAALAAAVRTADEIRATVRGRLEAALG